MYILTFTEQPKQILTFEKVEPPGYWLNNLLINKLSMKYLLIN